MVTTYKNIPVDEETYDAVKVIAESNGFGKRGMGMQVKDWAAREMAAPVCSHPKTPVEVQWMAENTSLASGILLVHRGLFCPTCNRVYREATKAKGVATETLTGNAQDSYGQPAPVVEKKRTRRAEVVRGN